MISDLPTLIRDAGEARAVLFKACPDYAPGVVAANIVLREALDRLATLAQAAEGMAEALEPFATEAAVYDPDEGDSHLEAWVASPLIGELRTARTALQTYSSHHPQPAAQASGEPDHREMTREEHWLMAKVLSASTEHLYDIETAGAGGAAEVARLWKEVGDWSEIWKTACDRASAAERLAADLYAQLDAVTGEQDAFRSKSERQDKLIALLRADMLKAFESRRDHQCQGCDAPLFESDEVSTVADVPGCWGLVCEGGPPSPCYRYRTEQGADRSWPECEALSKGGADVA